MKNCTRKSINLLVYVKELYYNLLCTVDARILQASIEEKTSNAHSSKCRETCSGEIDSRIQGLLHSTVQLEDHTRKEAVKKLIHQFETHPNRVALKAISRNTHSASSRRTRSAAWRTWSTSRFAKTFPSRMQQLYHMLDERYCTLYLRNLLAPF